MTGQSCFGGDRHNFRQVVLLLWLRGVYKKVSSDITIYHMLPIILFFLLTDSDQESKMFSAQKTITITNGYNMRIPGTRESNNQSYRTQ